MRIKSRKLCVLLLLAFIVGQLSLTVHAASHANTEHSICQTCHLYNNASHAVAQAAFVFNTDTDANPCPVFQVVNLTTFSDCPFQQRAPPTIA